MVSPPKILVRRDTRESWEETDPVLHDGEIAYVTDTNEMVIGDGTRHFSELTPIGLNPIPEPQPRSAPEWDVTQDLTTDHVLIKNNWTGKKYRLSARDIANLTMEQYEKLRHILGPEAMRSARTKNQYFVSADYVKAVEKARKLGH